MPSVSTQTGWSWLRDVAEIEKLARSFGERQLDRLSALQRDWTSDADEEKDDVIRTDETPTSPSQDPNTASRSVTLPPIVMQGQAAGGKHVLKRRNSKPRSVTFSSLPDKVETVSSPDEEENADGANKDDTASSPEEEEEDAGTNNVSLPPILPRQQQQPRAKSESEPQEVSLPPANSEASDEPRSIFRDLEKTEYSEEEEEESEESDCAMPTDSDKEDDSSTASDEEEESDGAASTLRGEEPMLPALESAAKLSWPVILQYVKESESAAAQYFSLENKEAVRRRVQGAKAVLPTSHEDGQCGQSEEVDAGSSGRESDETRPEIVTEPISKGKDAVDDTESQSCHFCGKQLQRRSLLADARDIDKIREEEYICCAEFKEYTILVAVCMQQMVEKMRAAPPKRISLKPPDTLSKKELIEARALAILRRKRRWEEIRRKKEEEREAKRQMKGTKVIKFTLDSPNEVQENWATKNKPADSHNHRERRVSRRRKKTQEKTEMFSADILERLKAQATTGTLERRVFSADKSTCLTLLPDRTGYCNYPSGHKAVVIFSLYEGALAYVVFEDSDYPQVLAYADEMGRSCCHFLNGKTRFFSTSQLMLLFDASSQTHRKLKAPTNSTGSILFQPISMPLNKQVTFKCNQDSTSILLAFPHNHVKFTISSKLHKGEVPQYQHQLQATMQAAELYLSNCKSRIGQLLHLLQNISQIQKLSRLEALYGGTSTSNKGTPTSRLGPRNPAGREEETSSTARKRTRSMDTIKVSKKDGKHNRAMTLDLT